MPKKKKDSNKSKDFSVLVREIYKDEGVRPLSKAMTEASRRWKKPKTKSK